MPAHRTMHRGATVVVALALCSLFSSRAPAQSCAMLSPGAVSWWDGDAVSGGTARDIFGQSPATLRGGVSTAPGLVGNAFVLDGASGHLSTGRTVIGAGTDLAIEAWIRLDPAGSGERCIFSEIGTTPAGNSAQVALRVAADNSLDFLRMTSATTAYRIWSSAKLSPGVWTHVAVIASGSGSPQLYLNGANQSGGISPSSPYTPAAPAETLVGVADGGRQPFRGSIDELTVYCGRLTFNEIARIFQAGISGKCKAARAPMPAGLLHLWDAEQVCSTPGGAFALDLGRSESLAVGTSQAAICGVAGKAYTITPTTTPLRAGPGRVLGLQGAPFTVEAWIQPWRWDYQTVAGEIGTTSGSTLGQHQLRLTPTGAMQFFHYDATGVKAVISTATVIGWTHVAGVHDPADPVRPLKVYVNGVDDQNPVFAGSYTGYAPVEFRIGGGDGRFNFYGDIDEVTYFDRALTPARISGIWRAGAWGKDKSQTNGARCLPGSKEDFAIESSVGGSVYAYAPQKAMQAQDFLSLRLLSPNGSYVGSVPALVIQAYPNGSPPSSFPGIPELHLTWGLSIAFNGATTPGWPVLLPASGMPLLFKIPPGLEGFTVRMQGLAVAPALASNGLFATSQAHDFRVQ